MKNDMNDVTSGESAVGLIDNGITYNGSVIFFSAPKGIGFLYWEIDGVKMRDMFIHFSDIAIEGYKTLAKDQKVTFQVGANKNGDPKGVLVTPIK